MNYQRLQPYSLITRLSAAVYLGDMQLAQRILDESLYDEWGQSIILGKRIARPEPLAPLSEGSNLDDCISRYGFHNGYGKHEDKLK